MTTPLPPSSGSSNPNESQNSEGTYDDFSEDIDLSRLFARLRRGVAATLGLAAIGLAFSAGIYLVASPLTTSSTSMRVAFAFSGFGRGEYPDHSKFQPDDLLAPDKIALQMAVLGSSDNNKRTLLSGAWGRFMYRPRRAKFTPTALWCDLSAAEWLHRKMEQNIYMQTATWLVSRELTEAAGPWDTRLLGDDDGEYFCRVLMVSDNVRFVRDSKVYYRSFGYNSLSYIGLSARKCEAHWLSMQLHIGYLRSLEDGARARAACLQYLRNCLIYFYPERLDIVQQAQKMALDLGEPLGEPILSWKYSWIRAAFGWEIAKKVQVSFRKIRWQLEKVVDKSISQVERQGVLPGEIVLGGQSVGGAKPPAGQFQS